MANSYESTSTSLYTRQTQRPTYHPTTFRLATSKPELDLLHTKKTHLSPRLVSSFPLPVPNGHLPLCPHTVAVETTHLPPLPPRLTSRPRSILGSPGHLCTTPTLQDPELGELETTKVLRAGNSTNPYLRYLNKGAPKMARKPTPQPLTLAESTNITSDSFQRSPLSPISPKSPRSPFSKFSATARKLHSQTQAELAVQAAESQPPSSQPQTLPSSQTVPSLPTQPQTTDKQDRDRPARGGFFSNYKASKSSSRLQEKAESTRQLQEDSMSRDTERPGIAVVSSKDKSRSGTNLFLRTCHSKS